MRSSNAAFRKIAPGLVWSLALVPPLAMIALCVRSYYARDCIIRGWNCAWIISDPTVPGQTAVEEADGSWQLASGLGSVSLMFSNDPVIFPDDGMWKPFPLRVSWLFSSYPASLPYVAGARGALGFKYYSEDDPLGRGIIMSEFPKPLARGYFLENFVVPFWALIGLSFAPLMMWKSYRLIHAWRARPGFCARCGYDLRASTARCPECGTPIATAVK